MLLRTGDAKEGEGDKDELERERPARVESSEEHTTERPAKRKM